MVRRNKSQDKYKILFWSAVAVIVLLLVISISTFFYIKNRVEDSYQGMNSLSHISDPSYVGLSLEEAQATARKEKLELRIVRREGAPYFLNDDYRTNRVNVSIERGKVVKAERY